MANKSGRARPARPGGAAPMNNSRRTFLKGGAALALGAAAVSQAGCIALPLVGESLGPGDLDMVSGRLPSLSPLPKIKVEARLLSDSYGTLSRDSRREVRSALSEWYSLSSFSAPSLNPHGLRYIGLDSVSRLVFPVVRADSYGIFINSYGSGVFITPRHVLSAAHVLRDSPLSRLRLRVSQPDGKAAYVPFSAAAIRTGIDLALFKVHPDFSLPSIGDDDSRPVAVLSPRLPASFSSAYLLGYPRRRHSNTTLLSIIGMVARTSSYSDSFSFLGFGERSVLHQDGAEPGYSSSRGATLHGSSGGPVVGTSGQVLGIASMGTENDFCVAMGPLRIRIVVTSYLSEVVAPKIRELAGRVMAGMGRA